MAGWKRNDMLYFDSASKFAPKETHLRLLISDLRFKSDTHIGKSFEAEWDGEPIQLTFGQAKMLQDINCRVIMTDEKGKYYEVPADKVPYVNKVYIGGITGNDSN